MIQKVNFRLVAKIHALILSEQTGPSEIFAAKLDISRATLFNYLSYLKEDMQAPIEFDEQRKTYYYTYKTRFFLSEKILRKLLDEKDDNGKDAQCEDDEEDMDEDLIDESELDILFGGTGEEDWYKDQDDSDDTRLDDDIDFSDF